MLIHKGLSDQEAEKRLKQHGPNKIKEVSKDTSLKILFRQIKSNFIIYLLVGAMVLSFLVDKSITAYTILVIILVIIVTGFIQEYRAGKSIKALKNILVPISLVIRNGKEQEIESYNLVPGDIIILRNGEKVPADCLLLEENELRVNESILTGESKEVSKEVCVKKAPKNKNMVFMGTHVVNGRGLAKIIKTGMHTKFGKIANLISITEKELPLQKKINKIAKYTVFFALIISFLTGAIIIARSSGFDKQTIVSVLTLIIALSVSAFPEGFPVVLITTLSTGAYRMSKKNAIVNRMSIIETLGETTVICSDKTGTITKGEMTIRKIFANDNFYDLTGTGYKKQGYFLKNNKKINVNNNSVLKTIMPVSYTHLTLPTKRIV
mgnify:CR=1 FL=1